VTIPVWGIILIAAVFGGIGYITGKFDRLGNGPGPEINSGVRGRLFCALIPSNTRYLLPWVFPAQLVL
jgi:hypothetical protein